MVAAAVAVAIAIVMIARGRSRPAPRPARELAPAPGQVRYRFATAGVPDPRHELDAAIAELARRVERSGQAFDLADLASLLYRRAQLAGDRADYAAAEAAARRSLAILPAPNGATLTLAKLAAARHDFREAIRLAHTLRRRSPAVPTVLATAHLALGELVDAARYADQAVARTPDASTYLTRALVLQAQGRDAEAEADFVAAARVEPYGDPQGAARLRALWARFLFRRGELDAAAAVLDEALRIAPDHALARAYRGELRLRRGDPAGAAADLDQAFATSRQIRYLIDEARALELAGDRAGAEALRAAAERSARAELATGGLGHRLELVEILIDRGDPARITEAIALAREEVAHRPSADTHFQLARALGFAGAIPGALAEIHAALATGVHDARIDELASRLEARAGHPARAALYARLAAELDPEGTGWRALGMP